MTWSWRNSSRWSPCRSERSCRCWRARGCGSSGRSWRIRRSRRRGRSPRGDRGRRVALNEELSHHFPVQPNEDLYFIRTGQPLGGRCFPFGEAIAAGLAIPRDRFIMDEFALAIPKRSPLRAGGHLIIGKHRTHVSDRVLKNSLSSELIEIRTIECELKRTEHRIGIRRHLTFK